VGFDPFPAEQVESAFPWWPAGGRLFLFQLLILRSSSRNWLRDGAQLGPRAAFGMGRNDALPKGFFGKIEAKRQIPATEL